MMILDAIAEHALKRADAVAIQGADDCFSYAQLALLIEGGCDYLHAQQASRIALLMDNTPAVLVADLAVLKAGLALIPMPLFFSAQQVGNALHHSAADLFVSNLDVAHVEHLLMASGVGYVPLANWQLAGEDVSVYRLQVQHAVALPDAVQKITYTSGSTGDAKGVCLTPQLMYEVAHSLLQATQACAEDRHLCLLPYATLLENIAGMYVPLLAGATVCLPSLAGVGMQGSSGLDIAKFVSALHTSRATSCVMIPQMLQALLAAVAVGSPKPESLRYIAVGGAPVSEQLLNQAELLGLPVYEGYGLSEASSVVTLNTPLAQKKGSVGRVLPHMALHIADDGEIILQGGLFSGYLGGDAVQPKQWASGDIGHLDDEGFLYIEGRKKHIFITSFGRNVSPEWVEREFNIEPAIAQCCVFGEAKPFNVAVVVLRQGFAVEALEVAFASANQRLPDYAQVHHWIVAEEAFSIENEQWTGTGRPRRTFIKKHYHQAIMDVYEGEI